MRLREREARVELGLPLRWAVGPVGDLHGDDAEARLHLFAVAPAPSPVRSGEMRGHRGAASPWAPTIAAPVGVTVSNSMPAWYVGMPRRHSIVAGAGNGRTPCRAFTYPCPIGSGDTRSLAP